MALSDLFSCPVWDPRKVLITAMHLINCLITAIMSTFPGSHPYWATGLETNEKVPYIYIYITFGHSTCRNFNIRLLPFEAANQ